METAIVSLLIVLIVAVVYWVLATPSNVDIYHEIEHWAWGQNNKTSTIPNDIPKDDFAQFVKDFGAHCKANRCYPESDFAIVEFKGSHYVGACTDHTITDELWAILGVYPSREEAYSLILDLYIPF